MILAALLAGCAAALVLGRPSAERRLRALVPAPAMPPGPLRSAPTRRLVPVLGGLVLWWLVGGPAGVALGAGLALGGPIVMARLDAQDPDEEEVALRLPLALDLLAACLAGGAVLRDALEVVAAAVGGPCGERFARVAGQLAVGTPPAEAFRALGADRGPAGAAARALTRGAEGGAPVAGAVARVAQEARRSGAAAATRRARRAGVQAVGPLTTCFLPAFVLLGLVPTIVGLALPLLNAL